MTAALLSLALLVLIPLVTIALGAATRLLAAWIVTPREEHAALRPGDRLLRGNALVVRELQPDGTHPTARLATFVEPPEPSPAHHPRLDLVADHPVLAGHGLR